ncbi:hypothetical protein [Trabulsiella guamensis]
MAVIGALVVLFVYRKIRN